MYHSIDTTIDIQPQAYNQCHAMQLYPGPGHRHTTTDKQPYAPITNISTQTYNDMHATIGVQSQIYKTDYRHTIQPQIYNHRHTSTEIQLQYTTIDMQPQAYNHIYATISIRTQTCNCRHSTTDSQLYQAYKHRHTTIGMQPQMCNYRHTPNPRFIQLQYAKWQGIDIHCVFFCQSLFLGLRVFHSLHPCLVPPFIQAGCVNVRMLVIFVIRNLTVDTR